MSSFSATTPLIWGPKPEIQFFVLFTASSRFQLAVSIASTLMSGYLASTFWMPFVRSSSPDWPSGPCSTTMLPLPPRWSAIICISCSPALTSSGCTLPAMSLLSSAALTGTSGMPLALAEATCGPSESACTGTTMMASTPWLISESTWLAWVDTSRLAEFQTSSMLLSLAYWSIPSLPAVMNELMS